MTKNEKTSKEVYKRSILLIGLGLLAGILTRLTDLLPSDNIWAVNSIATLFGFWIATVTLVIFFSFSNINAAFNVFLYLVSMNIGFYCLKYILGFFLPIFQNEGFQWNLFIIYNILALFCAIISYILYYWNKKGTLSSFLYGLPVGGLAAETLGVGIYFFNNKTFLFQLLFNFISMLIIGFLFLKNVVNKVIYILTIILIAAIGYSIFYRPFLSF